MQGLAQGGAAIGAAIGEGGRVAGLGAEGGGLDLTEGYLRSMLASGKPQLLVSVAQGLLSSEDRATRLHAGAAGVAAAWRLCNWPHVGQFLEVRVLCAR